MFNSPSTPPSSTSTREPRSDVDGSPPIESCTSATPVDQRGVRGAEEIRADLANCDRDGVPWPAAARRLLGDVEPLLAEVERLRGDSRAEAVIRAAVDRDNEFAKRRHAEDRARVAESKLRAAELLHCWTNEDGRRFVFADDLATALGITS
jgi:hypothetical protein